MEQLVLSCVSDFFTGLHNRRVSSELFTDYAIVYFRRRKLSGPDAIGTFFKHAFRRVSSSVVTELEVTSECVGAWWVVNLQGQPNSIPFWVEVYTGEGSIQRVTMEEMWAANLTTRAVRADDPDPSDLRIIYYHRFRSIHAKVCFDEQCAFLRKQYDVVSLDDAWRELQDSRVTGKRHLVVAVDDGHRDFYSVAMPALVKYKIPAICYVVTDFVDGKDWLWFDKVDFLCAQSAEVEVTSWLPSGEHLVLPLRTYEDRNSSASKLKKVLKALPNDIRLATLEALPAAFNTCVPRLPPAEYAALTWDQIREMSRLGLCFGAHTRTHPILSRISSNEASRSEILDSKDRIEFELGEPVFHFAYPNGKPEDLRECDQKSLHAAGYRTAVTTMPGINYKDSNPLILNRIWVEPEMTAMSFAKRVSGFRSKG